MKRLCAPLALLSFFAVVAAARADHAGVPKLDVQQSCKEAQEFGGYDNSTLAYKGCMQDENDAFKQLQQNWSRYKEENRSTCLAQGLSPMPSYVEILTCIEMYDSAGMLNKGAAAGQLNSPPPPAPGNPTASPPPALDNPAASPPPAGGK